MDASEREKIPMLSAAYFQSDDRSSSTSREFSLRTRSASMPIPMNYLDSSENEHNLFGFTRPLWNERRSPAVQMSGPLYVNHNREFIFQPPQGALKQTTSDPIIEGDLSIENKDWHSDDYGGKDEHLLKSGQLGMCNNPYRSTCPIKRRQKQSRTSDDAKFHNMIYGDAKGWAKRMCSFLHPYIPGVMNPYAKVVQQWNKFLVISCLFTMFLDPLFFFPLSVQQDNKCMVLDWPLTATLVVLRSITDFIYFLHILLQFRLAYVDRTSGGLVDEPKRIARNYLWGYFIIDFFVVLPLPQIIILLIVPDSIGGSGASNAKYLLRAAILVQGIPRLCRFLPFLAGSIFAPRGSNIIIYLLSIVWASHFFGSCWYLFSLQRVHECFRDACHKSNIAHCMEFIDCGHGNDYRKFTRNQRWESLWESWKNNTNATACFGDGDFDFGIYKTAVNLMTQKNVARRYVYSLFWGFQQMSTLAGNQVPSRFVSEVLFTMAVIAVGLFLFALLIGSMQNFLQSLESRMLEMYSRRRDVEQWMDHRHLPEELRRQVRDSEFFNWAATRGVNDEMLMENLPDDLQREIRRHLLKSVKKVRIFQLLD
ncbi:hypothetical protein CDL12_21559 [Handroanthus impetiginosus]|uniref:Ion transport domain-containing protein n=1 Tax=Handroanthus impetiginosus TaxID=429701 RepID=A0A2G9GKR3_9LAMI|nr:hypothetical protein CDL12_21559 [Handroanthus impetiginosus]